MYNSTGYSTNVIECANYGTVDVREARYGVDDAGKAVGGVLGSTAGDYGEYHLEGCLNEGDIYSANCISVGGVAGYLGGLGSTISFSENVGTITGANNSGGIAGYMGSAGGSITNSLNLGTVSGTRAAGVVGAGSRNNQTFRLNYTLDEASQKAYGNSVGASNADAVKAADGLRFQTFLDLINEGSTALSIVSDIYGGLPVLSWAYGVDPPGLGGIVENPDNDDPDNKDEENPPENPPLNPGEGQETGEGNDNSEGSESGEGTDNDQDGGTDTGSDTGTGSDTDTGSEDNSSDNSDSSDDNDNSDAQDNTDTTSQDGDQTLTADQQGSGSGRTNENEEAYQVRIDSSEGPDIQMEPEEEIDATKTDNTKSDETPKTTKEQNTPETETLVLNDDSPDSKSTSQLESTDSKPTDGSKAEGSNAEDPNEELVNVTLQDKQRMVELTVIDEQSQTPPSIDLTLDFWVYVLAGVLAAVCVGGGLLHEYVMFARSRRANLDVHGVGSGAWVLG